MEREKMNDELKPVRCGCGGEAQIRAYDTLSGESAVYVACSKCDISTRSFLIADEAITAWNKAMGERTAKVETVEKPNVFKCSECGQYFHSTAWG